MNCLDNKYVHVTSFPLKHRIPACGFLFREKKRSRNIRREFVQQHQIPVEWFQRILDGEDFIDNNGKHFANESIVRIPGMSRSYAYCSDTAYFTEVIDTIRGASLLYHEASFADEHEDIALLKFHSTARQAAKIAREAAVSRLMIGHFSQRYKESEPLIAEAREEFPDTIEAVDGLIIEIDP
jgi:ribonuclease Z